MLSTVRQLIITDLKRTTVSINVACCRQFPINSEMEVTQHYNRKRKSFRENILKLLRKKYDVKAEKTERHIEVVQVEGL